mmetsp:Transcript_14656/g.17053  ORF Transcript_14656/g.17053 Transcript_14656/m.17053 type:complete len:139 (-) Transcript_14656:152-568(-)
MQQIYIINKINMRSQIRKPIKVILNATLRPKLKNYQAARFLTAETSTAVYKLQTAVEQFRLANYSQELPSRCKKEIASAADIKKNGRIDENGLQTILHNIGAKGSLSTEDMKRIVQELGDSNTSCGRAISVDEMLKIL